MNSILERIVEQLMEIVIGMAQLGLEQLETVRLLQRTLILKVL